MDRPIRKGHRHSGKFLDPEINLSPDPVLNGDGTVKHSGMDNRSMGTVSEELVRKFNEELSLVTRSSDGQMLFLANMASKMNHDPPLGSQWPALQDVIIRDMDRLEKALRPHLQQLKLNT